MKNLDGAAANVSSEMAKLDEAGERCVEVAVKVCFCCSEYIYALILSLLLRPVVMQSIVMSMSVCLSVCQLAYPLKTAQPNFVKFFVTMPMARSSSNGVTIRYVLPVLWMTSLSGH